LHRLIALRELVHHRRAAFRMARHEDQACLRAGGAPGRQQQALLRRVRTAADDGQLLGLATQERAQRRIERALLGAQALGLEVASHAQTLERHARVGEGARVLDSLSGDQRDARDMRQPGLEARVAAARCAQ